MLLYCAITFTSLHHAFYKGYCSLSCLFTTPLKNIHQDCILLQMATPQIPSDNILSFEDFQTLLARLYINSTFISLANPNLNEFYLGPSFKDIESIEKVAACISLYLRSSISESVSFKANPRTRYSYLA